MKTNKSHYRVNFWGFRRRLVFKFVTTLMLKFVQSAFRFEVIGQEFANRFPEGSPVIFCGNHRSHLDALVLAAALLKPLGNRGYLASIAPEKSMQQSVLFRLTRKFGTFPLDKKNPELALNYFYETLTANLGIFIYPQGGRLARTPYHDYLSLSREGRTGVGRLILKMNGKVPVVPFFIHGSAEALGVGQTFPRWGSYVSITFGKPLHYDQYTKNDGWNENQEFYETARTIVNKLMLEIQQLLILTEKPFLHLTELLAKQKMQDLNLSEKQDRKLRNVSRKLAYIAPYEYDKYIIGISTKNF